MVESQGTVLVRGGAEGFTQQITAGRHHLVADEPVDVGGSDKGPGPYELILAALGSCMSMTIALYARRKQIPLRGVVIRLGHSRDHESDCENCMTDDVRLDRVCRPGGARGPIHRGTAHQADRSGVQVPRAPHALGWHQYPD